MIQIELPCCNAPADLPPGAAVVRCEACAIDHELAPDARDDRVGGEAKAHPVAIAA